MAECAVLVAECAALVAECAALLEECAALVAECAVVVGHSSSVKLVKLGPVIFRDSGIADLIQRNR